MHKLFSCLLLLLASANGSAQECLDYDHEVTLAGTIGLREFFGPPGYGENPAADRRERQALLLLDRPICVSRSADGNNDGETGQRSVTLVPLAPGLSLAPHENRHVVVQGKLFHASTGHHHTALLIQLRQEPRRAPQS